MLALDLFYDRQRNRFLAGLNSEADAVLPEFPQGDTVRLAIYNAVRNPDRRVSIYGAQPWTFDSIRASIVAVIDGAPDTGSFKFKVGAELSEKVEWPSSLATTAQIATWKANALAKLKAVTGVGTDAVVASDPAGTPANFLYFTWTDDADVRAIEIVENRLAPVCLPEVIQQRGAPGYQQIVKLATAPLVMVTDFEFPGVTQPTVTEQRAGDTGINAIQRLRLSATVGALEIGYSGTVTRRLATEGVTAAAIAAALNALVNDGGTNPTFAVTLVSPGVFDIEFIGPQAATAQSILTAEVFSSVPPTAAVGVLPLTNPAFERALNGARNVKLFLEVVIVDPDGESKIIREITFVNSATKASTEEELEEAGAIFIREITVTVDDSTLEPFATVAPGASFTPPTAVGAGASISITHNFNSRNTRVWVQYKSSISPEEWRELQRGGEFDWTNTSANVSVVNIVYPLTNASESDTFDRRRFKIFVSSPDAVLEIFGTIETTWAKVRESLPSGQTLTAKLAAIDAALGVLGGSLTINASQIVGLLSSSQIDISSISTAFASNSTFLTTLRTLITDSTLVENLSSSFTSSAAFLTTLKTLITNSEVINALSSSLVTNTVFASSLRTLIIEIIQGTAGALTDAVAMSFPDLAETYPAPVSETVLGLLPRASFAPADLGAIESGVPRATSTNADKYYTVGAAGASLGPFRRKRFKSGDVIYSTGLDWYLAEIDGTKHCAQEFARTLFTLEVNEQMLSLGTRLGFVYSFSLQCLGNVEAYYRFRLVRGTPDATGSANTDFEGISVVETLCDLKLVVTDVATMHTIGYGVTRPLTGDMVATKQIYTKKAIAATAPTDANIILRAVLDRFDTEDVAEPRGQIILRTPVGQLATIVAL